LPQPPFRVEAEVHERPAAQRKKRVRENLNLGIQTAVAIGSILAFFATAYYAGITRKTLVEIRKQTPAIEQSGNAASQAITQAEQHFRAEERPWLIAFPDFLPQAAFFAPKPDGTFALGAVVQGKNIGRTPAVQTQKSPYEIIIGPAKEAKKKAMDFAPDYGQSGRFMMNPDIAMTAPIHHIERSRITADDLEKLNSGAFSLYIVGATRYKDVFSPPIAPYETPYCFEYSNKGQPLASCLFGGEIH